MISEQAATPLQQMPSHDTLPPQNTGHVLPVAFTRQDDWGAAMNYNAQFLQVHS
jgi:hypothetical protein